MTLRNNSKVKVAILPICMYNFILKVPMNNA